ncbi:hypothetical protein LEP1GSC051_4433 [Leptospira sp. P2653]|nr:hypothetical protein LEP1GSC051_4433 [Leptospira sp. P2653]
MSVGGLSSILFVRCVFPVLDRSDNFISFIWSVFRNKSSFQSPKVMETFRCLGKICLFDLFMKKNRSLNL